MGGACSDPSTVYGDRILIREELKKSGQRGLVSTSALYNGAYYAPLTGQGSYSSLVGQGGNAGFGSATAPAAGSIIPGTATSAAENFVTIVQEQLPPVDPRTAIPIISAQSTELGKLAAQSHFTLVHREVKPDPDAERLLAQAKAHADQHAALLRSDHGVLTLGTASAINGVTNFGVPPPPPPGPNGFSVINTTTYNGATIAGGQSRLGNPSNTITESFLKPTAPPGGLSINQQGASQVALVAGASQSALVNGSMVDMYGNRVWRFGAMASQLPTGLKVFGQTDIYGNSRRDLRETV